jgi:aldose 1-epimerase
MNKLMKLIAAAWFGITATCFVGCTTLSPNPKSSITQAPFGRTADGHAVEIYTLRNSQGAEARIMTYGGIVQSLSVPDKHGKLTDVVLGYDHLQGYIDKNPYFGALIGRYGNRIAGGKFTLEGQTYTLATNNGPNSLHGGRIGFDKVVWTAQPMLTTQGPALILAYVSKDDEEGFPGNLEVTAIYTLTEDNALKLEFTATTDQPTVINLTHHSYFNLAGQGSGDILGHVVYINANQTTPLGKDQITTGEFADVAGTPFDFRQPTTIGARINDPDPALQQARGYDQNWVINKPLGKFDLSARVVEPGSGRVLEVWSDEPGLQFYTGNFLNGTIKGKGGVIYQQRAGFCLEPQHYPDSPNKPNFPSVVLQPDQTFRSTIVYKFGVQ